MVAHDLDRFRTIVLADPALQAELLAHADRESFVVHAVELAAAHGLELAPSDVDDAITAARHEWMLRWV